MSQSSGKTSSPWGQEAKQVLADQDVNPTEGLSAQAVKERRRKIGSNRLRTKDHQSVWKILADQFKNIIIWLLMANLTLS